MRCGGREEGERVGISVRGNGVREGARGGDLMFILWGVRKEVVGVVLEE